MRGHSLDECKARPVLNKGKEPLQDDTTNPNGAKEKAVAGQGLLRRVPLLLFEYNPGIFPNEFTFFFISI
jgi:hypothetical protein